MTLAQAKQLQGVSSAASCLVTDKALSLCLLGLSEPDRTPGLDSVAHT